MQASLTLTSFMVGAASFAVDVRDTLQVAEPGPVTPLPRAPAHILGLTLVGSRAVAVLDLARFLELPESDEPPLDAAPRIVLCKSGALEAAIPCQRVEILAELPDKEVMPPRLAEGDRFRRFCRAEIQRDDRVVSVIDIVALLEAARVQR